MSDKVDFKKKDKDLYKPSSKTPVIINVPELSFLMINGKGNPGTSEEFQNAVSALYSISYKIKMSPKKDRAPEGYYDYVVPPLEGIWDLSEGSDHKAPLDKGKLIWTIMIRQPEFVKEDFVILLRNELIEKEGNTALKKIYLKSLEEGPCCQMMHLGPFDDEPASFQRMEEWIAEQGYARTEMSHREIYLNDFRKVAPEKMKTVLRFKVAHV